jgi:hypothetical protein
MRPLPALFALCAAALPLTAHASSMAAPIPNGKHERTCVADVNLRVFLPDGTPAANAEIVLGWQTYPHKQQFQRLKANADGTFHKKLTIKTTQNPSMFSVVAYLPGRGIAWQQTSMAGGSKNQLQLKMLNWKMQAPVALSGRVVTPEGKPAAGVVVRIANLLRVRTEFRRQFVHFSSNQQGFLPRERMSALYTAKTDAEGRFRLTELPPDSVAQIAPQKGLLLAPGSSEPIRVSREPNHELGILTVAPPARLTVRLQDRATGKPLIGVPFQVNWSEQSMQFAAHMFSFRDNFQGNVHPMFRSAHSGTNGETTIEGLYPGEYMVILQNRIERVMLESGKTTALALRARHGVLKGRLVDAEGKPLARTPIFLNAGFASEKAMPIVEFGQFGWEKQARTHTDSKGEFVVHQFPWESAWVTVRANRGNDRAEFHGKADKIGDTLVLKMKKNALMTVTGRLIDTKRKPLPNAQFISVHWEPSPRAFWVANAREFKVDAQGRFRVTGLERGESFSFITSQNHAFRFQRAQGGLQNASMAFESPRFTTPPSGQGFDLGDVMIHPSDEPEEVQQSYGISSESFSNSPGFIPAPTEDAVTAAKQAWREYRTRLTTGDVEGLYRLTSSASPGWSEDRRKFLLQTSLRPTSSTENADALYALRLAPRAAALQMMGKIGTRTVFGGVDTSAEEQELDANPNWVFLAEKRDKAIVPVAALRKEEGNWRVVTAPEMLITTAFFTQGAAFVLMANQFLMPDADTWSVPAPKLEATQLEAAREVGAQFLRQWSLERPDFMRTLTSPLSVLHQGSPEAYRAMLKRRPDKGHAPLSPEESVTLTPLIHLTQWEAEWLTSFAQSRGFRQFGGLAHIEGRGGFNSAIAVGGRVNADVFPKDYVKRGDIALFRYTAEGKEFLMVLARSDSKWKVLEPALLLSETSERHLAMR